MKDCDRCDGSGRIFWWNGQRPKCPSCKGTGKVPDDYVGGACPDPLRCAHWQRFASGPWTCESNHPRVA